jgi:hypothetical protein
MVSSWRTTSVCHFAPLFYLAHCTQTPYSGHKLLESKFTHHTHVHAHTHGDYSHSLRSQISRIDFQTEGLVATTERPAPLVKIPSERRCLSFPSWRVLLRRPSLLRRTESGRFRAPASLQDSSSKTVVAAFGDERLERVPRVSNLIIHDAAPRSRKAIQIYNCTHWKHEYCFDDTALYEAVLESAERRRVPSPRDHVSVSIR